MSWQSQGTLAILNLDTYVYSSMHGTIESIKNILSTGRINDAYALLRKYYDSTIINVYTNLYLEDNFSIQNFVVTKIDNWLKGKEKIPEYRVMSQYIQNSQKLSAIRSLLHVDDQYKNIRERCNEHTHYNYYRTILLNDNEVYMSQERIEALKTFSADIEDIFIQHLSYIFYLKENYMMASDYIDSLDVGLKPDDASLYYVAPFIQEIFDVVIKKKRMDIFEEIKRKTGMMLE
ncbi:hypothetical protein [Chryseotalea sanaruensis]|nr:hypothetical protein [Chryseotalea sanaruensis]